jgi:CheY-like chemotaxis protein
VGTWAQGGFDLVLMDIHMPEMDGVQATKEIRRREAEAGRGRTSVIALTANAMTDQVSQHLAASMDDCVTKPIDAAQMFSAMSRACGRAQAIEPPTIEARPG